MQSRQPERNGIALKRQVISVPRDPHEVGFDRIQHELFGIVPINEQWDFRFRIPVSMKGQKFNIRFVSPVSKTTIIKIDKSTLVQKATTASVIQPFSSPQDSASLFDADVPVVSGG